MIEEENQDVTGRRPRPRTRGGLGRGLGALIPGIEEMPPEKAERPLDVFFPDRSGAKVGTNGAVSSVRGGSARDLLSPGKESRIVSRETKKAKPAGVSGPHSETDQNENVSRETFIETVASDKAVARKSRSTEKRVARSSDTSSPIVSRETIAETTTVPKRQPAATALSQKADSGTDLDHEDLIPVPGATFGSIPTDWIIPNLKQPRDVFDRDELSELAQSIREVGVLQPVVVRAITAETLAEPGQAARLADALTEQPNARYELIMGERRWRAASLAQLPEIPAIIRTTDEDELLRDALIENLHRVQLNPLEEAAAYNQLLEDFSYTQEELSKKIFKSRSQVANTLRLLKLPSSVQWKVAANVLSAGHARALLSLTKQSEMEALADRIVSEGLSVRATEEIIRFGRKERPRRTHVKPYVPPAAQRVAEAFAAKLDTSVKITVGANKGRLIIEYADADDLNRIAAILDLSSDNPQ